MPNPYGFPDPLPRYIPPPHAAPTPQLPHAAPAPAAEAGTLGGECSSFCAPGEPCWVTDDGRCDAALSATAPATPQAAGTGTGGWTREAPYTEGRRWVVWRYQDLINGDWHTEPAVVTLYRVGPYLRIMDHDGETILLYGPTYEPQEPPPGWREAIAALDTPQEADHAAQ